MKKVLLNSVERAKEFVRLVNKMDTDVCLKSGKYVVDAKSILGVFSLNLTSPLVIEFSDYMNEKKYMEELKDFEA